MNAIRFNQVFIALLVLSALCAFAIPARVTARVRANFAILFYPVAKPANAIGSALHHRISRNQPIDDGAPPDDSRRPRSDDTLLQENQELRVLVANLNGQLVRLAEQEAQRKSVGEARQWCDPFKVTGSVSDVAGRAMLHLAGNTSHGLRDGQAALYGGAEGGGIAGRVERASVASSTLRLITDRGFSVTIGFARIVPNASTGKLEFVRIATPPVLATGDGHSSMWIRNLTLQQKDQAGIAVGDWVILNDADWPDALQWYRIGRVKSVEKYASGPGFAEIRVEPPTDLRLLQEVLVMTKGN